MPTNPPIPHALDEVVAEIASILAKATCATERGAVRSTFARRG